MAGDIDKLTRFIAQHFKFDSEHYPELAGASDEQKLSFAVRHSALHFAKTTGKFAAVSEDIDHGGVIDIDAIKENIPKALINVLRLAELLGMTESDILTAIEKKYGDKMNLTS